VRAQTQGGVVVSVGQRLGIWIACLLGVVVVGAIDAVTGFELSMSIIYLVPVTWAAWRLGRGAGVALAVAAADTDESGTASAFERLRADLWRVGRTDGTAVRFSGGLLVSEGPVQVGALLKRPTT
jgi:hypothetical protein